jgi:beta-lactamase class C
MKKKQQLLLIGTLIILLPILLAQVWKSNTTPVAVVPPVQPPPPPPYINPAFDQLMHAYEHEIDLLTQTSQTPGFAIAVVKDSSVVYLKGFGVRAAGSSATVDAHTVFRIASVSKCFASFLTGILVSDSVLRWNDPVIQYLPDFRLKSPEQTRALQLRHVLSHTTGLPYHTYTNLVESGLELPVLLGKLKDVDLFREVGKEYSYQNVAYSLIGEVIHKATGKPYEVNMTERVFRPLHMEQASMDYTTLMTNPNIARPHKSRGGRWVPASITSTYYNVAPAGGVNASISDMANWMIALLGHREDVIDAATLHQLFSPQILAPSKNRNYGRSQRLSSSYYGLGWRVLYYPNDTVIYHGGFVNGYRSEVAVNTKDHIAICILANAPGAVADKGIPAFFTLFRAHRDSILVYDDRQRRALSPNTQVP